MVLMVSKLFLKVNAKSDIFLSSFCVLHKVKLMFHILQGCWNWGKFSHVRKKLPSFVTFFIKHVGNFSVGSSDPCRRWWGNISISSTYKPFLQSGIHHWNDVSWSNHATNELISHYWQSYKLTTCYYIKL